MSPPPMTAPRCKLYVNGVAGRAPSPARPRSRRTTSGSGSARSLMASRWYRARSTTPTSMAAPSRLRRSQALASTSTGNSAPNAPTAQCTGQRRTGIGISPTLSVGVSDPDSDPLTVTFFGRPFASGNFAQIAQHTGVASGTNDTATWSSLGAGQTLRVVRHRQRRHPHRCHRPDLDLPHHRRAPTRSSSAPATSPSCAVTEDTATGNDHRGDPGHRLHDRRQRLRLRHSPPSSRTATHRRRGAARRSRRRTRPVPGNHDWGNTGTASDNLAGYFGYFGAERHRRRRQELLQLRHRRQQLAHRQPRQRVRSSCPAAAAPARRRTLWLEADLAANSTQERHRHSGTSRATARARHAPDRRSSRSWDDLYAAGVDILLDGHDHIYERTRRR